MAQHYTVQIYTACQTHFYILWVFALQKWVEWKDTPITCTSLEWAETLYPAHKKKEADSGLLPFEHAVYLAVMVLSAALPPEEWTVGTLGTAILHTKRYMVHVMSSDLLRFWPQLAMDGTGSQWRSINDDDDACVPGVSPCSNVTR